MPIHDELNKIYQKFFEELNLDQITGKTPDGKKRFATKLAIGENYQQSKKKILFVSLDMGRDEKFVESNVDSFQDFDERSDAVCSESLSKNPHMAGVYGTALYFLKDNYGWEKSWSVLENQNQFFREALIHNAEHLPADVLSYISLVNFYNFVTVGRAGRAGGSDRVFLDEPKEIQLLIDIIGVITPDIIIVQSKGLKHSFVNKIKQRIDPKIEIYVGVHPSIFGRNINLRRPINYMKDLLENGCV